ncbi:hypothetical protein C9374_012876 [Naegleria lovaniensis]|uniref:F-box domain-containing protein n=1 Tax=Naegleria lovaniensis TaxID=51637 RepID=A0AA88GCM4_NAELO|nr:uncharacterized protein C9374_012876 [Naegleria lovaniensis]KAG2373030.1 hypothetical protein C9374_012876 [Naegleria lovaniensis]
MVLCKDVLRLVASYIDMESLSSFRLVCREWNASIENEWEVVVTNKSALHDSNAQSSESENIFNPSPQNSTNLHLYRNEFWMDKLKTYFWKYLEYLHPVQEGERVFGQALSLEQRFNVFVLKERYRIQRHVKRLENKKKKLASQGDFIYCIRPIIKAQKERALGRFKYMLLVHNDVCNYLLKLACDEIDNALEDNIIKLLEWFVKDLKSEDLLIRSFKAMKKNTVDTNTLDKYITTHHDNVSNTFFDHIECFSFEQFKELAHHIKESPKTELIRTNVIIHLFKQVLLTDDVQNIDILTEILERKLGKPLFHQTLFNNFLNSFDDSKHPISVFWDKHKLLLYMEKKFDVSIGASYLTQILSFSEAMKPDSNIVEELIRKHYQQDFKKIETFLHFTLARSFRKERFLRLIPKPKLFLYEILEYLVLTYNLNLFNYAPSDTCIHYESNLVEYFLQRSFSQVQVDWDMLLFIMKKQIEKNNHVDLYSYFEVETIGSKSVEKLNLASLKNSKSLQSQVLARLGRSVWAKSRDVYAEIEFFEQKTNLIPNLEEKIEIEVEKQRQIIEMQRYRTAWR